MNKEKNKGQEINLNVYEFNKVNMKQIKPLEKNWVEEHCKEVASDMFNSDSQYWMLLNRERYDITIFNIVSDFTKDIPKLAIDLYECLYNRGEVIDFTTREDKSYEIWIRVDNMDFVYYLFNYNIGVIEV